MHLDVFDVFEIPHNKNIVKLFSKNELLFLGQTDFCSGSSQMLILKFHILRASLPPSSFLSNFTLANRNPSLTQHSSWFPSVSLFSLNPFDHMRSQVLDIPNYMPSQANQIYYQAIYTSWYLWVKYANHQKPESLRVSSFSQLNKTVDNNPIFNTQYAEFSTKWEVLLHFTALLKHTTTPIISTKNPHLYFSQFSPLYSILTCSQIIFTIPTNTPFLYNSARFQLPIFTYNHTNNLDQRYFPYLIHLGNSGYAKGQGN